MDKQNCPVEITNSVFWLGVSDSEDFLQVNVFLIYRNGQGILIDPGPRRYFRETLRALEEVTPLESIKAMVVSNLNPDVCSSLPLWEDAGFRGQIVTHWKSGLHLDAMGLNSLFYRIKEGETGPLSNFLSLGFYCIPQGKSVTVACYDKESGSLFSSLLFSAFGKSQALFADSHYFKRMVYHQRNYLIHREGTAAFLKHVEALDPQLICPHHGSIIDHAAKTACDFLRGESDNPDTPVNIHGTGSVEDDDWERLHFELSEELILSSDEKLVDPVTGLYNTSFFLNFLPGFVESNPRGTIAYFRIDNMKEFNNSFGFREGDRVISTFATILQENKPEEVFLFRDAGPVLILMIPGTVSDNHMDVIEDLQNKVGDSKEFIQKMTCSAAVVSADEVTGRQEDYTGAVLFLIRERLRILDSMGNHSVCHYSETLETGDKKPRVMIIDPGMIYPKLMDEYLSHRGIEVSICRDGSEALREAGLFHPELILCETQVPQMDGMRIREQLLHSWDLRSIPFVFLSHLKTDESIKRAHNLGVFHYLKKPVLLSELEGLVRHLIGDSSQDEH